MSSLPDRALGAPSFPGDDGSPDPRVITALDAYANGNGGSADVLAALATCRLLVPVVAVLDEAGESPDGFRVDKSSHMATVSTTGRDGRRGQLAFTCIESMQRWSPAARPVPVSTRRAAEAALADGADALVIDLAGPVTFSVDAGELRALAAGWRPMAEDHSGAAWAVAVGLAQEPGRRAAAPAEGTTPVGGGRRARSWVSRSARRFGRALRGISRPRS
ncbi:MAG TPA: SseB family protein [Jiangellaceae bacterium]|nr:SseB family protein [Jiangellaceae bacterium]